MSSRIPSHRPVLAGLVLTMLITLVGAPAGQSLQSSPAKIVPLAFGTPTPDDSFASLVKADLILLGRISAAPEKMSSPGYAVPNYARVTLDVERTFKSTDGAPRMRFVNFYILIPPPAPLREGDHVLWFLTPPDENEVRTTVGRDAGFFLIRGDAHRTAENQRSNLGLWMNLDKTYTNALRTQLTKNLIPILERFGKSPAAAEREATEWIDHPENEDGRPVPLDILIAIVETVLGPTAR